MLGDICYCTNDNSTCGTNKALEECFPTEDPTTPHHSVKTGKGSDKV